ncbi:MAG: DUF1152 domain-containing protein, partial [Sulfolobaceae archaeon]
VFGLGGGGDAVSALIAYNYLSKLGYHVDLGAVTWERYVEDPIPGPICKDDFMNVKVINDVIVEVNKSSYSIRGGSVVIPQLVRILRILNTNGYSICVKYGVKGTFYGLLDFIQRVKKYDLIVGVDAGGDVLAKGNEENLLSPLIDTIMLSTLALLRSYNYNAVIATIGAGSDGELDQDYILQRISEVAKRGGLIDIKGIDKESAELISVILRYVNTEASRIPFEAFKGYYGIMKIRGGSREVKVSPISAVMFFLDPVIIAQDNITFNAVKETRSLEEVMKVFNDLGIYTEYNFELDLFSKLWKNSNSVSQEVIRDIRMRGRERLRIRAKISI